MEARSAPAQARYSPFLTSSLHHPSVPIPIPARRITTDPPPRSPDRSQPLSDLLFDMSPLSPTECPLRKHSLFHAQASGDGLHRNMRIPRDRPLAEKNSSFEDSPLYPNEPFLYSIPRYSLRPDMLHHRSRSEYVHAKVLQHSVSPDFVPTGNLPKLLDLSCSPSTTPSEGISILRCDQTDDSQTLLTSAFQVSVSSSDTYTTVSSTSTSPDRRVSRRISSKGSICALDTNICRSATAKQRSADYPACLRTSAAAPVISLAQAELATHTSGGKCNRSIKIKTRSPPYSTCPSQPRSPYTLSRVRRNSILQERSSRISDEDLDGPLKYECERDKFGVEKFVPMACSKRVGRDENVITANGPAELERGRSRIRGRSRA